MKTINPLFALILLCLFLSACNHQDSNPLSSMPVKKAALLLLKTSNIANHKMAITPIADNYFRCLAHQIDNRTCDGFYSVLAAELQKVGILISKPQLATFKPSKALLQEVRYQLLTNDEV